MQEFDGEYLYSVLKYLVNVGEIKKPNQFFEKLGKQFPGDKKIMTIAESLKKEGRKEGMQIGIEKGAENRSIEIAKNLLAIGKLSPEEVAKAANLPLEKVESLKTIH